MQYLCWQKPSIMQETMLRIMCCLVVPMNKLGQPREAAEYFNKAKNVLESKGYPPIPYVQQKLEESPEVTNELRLCRLPPHRRRTPLV